MTKSNTYCVMPHIGLAIQNNGDFCACNVNDWSFQSKSKEVLFVHKDSVTDAWNSHIRKMIAAGLDHGKPLPSCAFCFDLEASNTQSRRQMFNEAFKDVVPNPSQPTVLILKPGNTCNLACRSCNPATSTGWYRDAYQYEIQHNGYSGTIQEFTQGFENIRNGFNRDNTQLWDTFKEWLPNMTLVDIYGGEPFLAPAMFDCFEAAASLDKVDVRLHTNATIFNQRYLDILSRFKSVNIGISMDSDDATQMEYIRHPVEFSKVMDNIQKFVNWMKTTPNVTMQIAITVTPMNVMYLPKIRKNLEQMTGLSSNISFVTNPAEHDLRHIPQPVKQQLSEILKDDPKLVSYMNQVIPGCDIIWPKFWLDTKRIDAIRNQSFEDTFPEFYEMIKDYV